MNCVNGATNKWNQTFNYDAFGNISKGSSGPGITFAANYLLTGGGTNNQITSLSGITPTYDADGHMTYDGVHTYGWDAQSRMVSMDSTTVTYDALGRMVEKNVSGTYTQVVYGPQGGKFAVMNGQTLVQAFIPLPTGAKAVYTLAGLAFYRHHDHLGSSRLATTPSRTLYSSTAYAPFGEAYAQSGTTDLSFTGQDQDTVSGMHDFQDRRYMPVQGRWLSPDPMGLAAVDPTSPQSWNRYAYVVNNPLAMIDPFGDDGCYGMPSPAVCSNSGSDLAQPGSGGGGGDWYWLNGADGFGGSGGCHIMDASCAGGPGGPGTDAAGAGANIYGNAMSALNQSVAQSEAQDYANYVAGTFGDPCVYLNKSGTGVESVDHNSSEGECHDTGGTWVPPQPSGTIYGVNADGNVYAVQPDLNSLSCAFMDAGVKAGNSAVNGGKTAAKIGGGVAFVAGARGNLPVAAFGGAYAAAGGGYGLLGGAYAGFWQGMKYLGGCRAYGI